MNRKKSPRKIEITFDKKQTFPIEEAIKHVKQHATEKFDSSIELHAKLGIDPRQTTQQIRATVTLPHSFGKAKRILAFVTPDKAKDAKQAGADIIAGDEQIEELKKSGKIEFDIAIAVPEMMKKLAPVAKILGPRGLMPSPKNDTITTDIGKTVEEIRKGKISYKNDDTSNVHASIGKKSLDDAKIIENFYEFVVSLLKNKPSSSKGIYIRSLSICSSMGPSIKVVIPK